MATPVFPQFTCDSDYGPDKMRLRDYNEITQTRPHPLLRDAADPLIQRRNVTICTTFGEFKASTYFSSEHTTFHDLVFLLNIVADIGGTLKVLPAPYDVGSVGGWQIERRQEHLRDDGVVEITFQVRAESNWVADS